MKGVDGGRSDYKSERNDYVENQESTAEGNRATASTLTNTHGSLLPGNRNENILLPAHEINRHQQKSSEMTQIYKESYIIKA